MRLLFVIVSSVIFLTSCVNTRGVGSETAREICRQIGEALPSRSVDDTAQTIDEITLAYATFSLTCPEWGHLIPE
jgi:hypothetical protein